MIKYTVENNLMPPWGVDPNTGPWENDLSLTSTEKQMLLKWLNSGLPKRKDFTLKPVKRSNIITNPDYVMKLEKPIELPSAGFLKYKELIFDPKFTEDKWIKEIEFILKPKVVHHLTIYMVNRKILPQIIRDKNTSPDKLHFHAGKRSWAWSHGEVNYKDFGKNMGIKVPENTFFIIHIHYEPIGKKVIDSETKIKIKFHSKIPKYSLLNFAVINLNLNIPPYHNNFLDEIKYKIKRKNIKLAGVIPHMHLRGKSTSITVVNPEGYGREIFRKNPYNFNFQNHYMLKKPILIHKDSTIICRNWFDNSKNNPVNPDPSKNVKWGLNTNDEMSLCILILIVPSSRYNLYLDMKPYIRF